MKNMRIIFDTNILLDFLLGHEPYCDSAQTLFELCKNNQKIVSALENKSFEDFEDGLQHECAVSEYLEAIITRNKDDFASSVIPIYSAEEFIEMYL